MREALLRVTARAGLQEDDPLYAVIMAQAELQAELSNQHNKPDASHPAISKPTAKELFRDWSILIAVVLVIASIAFGAGYVLSWINLRKDADARIDRIIAAQQAAYHVPLFLASHRGSLLLGPLQPAEGHPETRGIIVRGGDLKLSEPWVSTDGATVLPIRE